MLTAPTLIWLGLYAVNNYSNYPPLWCNMSPLRDVQSSFVVAYVYVYKALDMWKSNGFCSKPLYLVGNAHDLPLHGGLDTRAASKGLVHGVRPGIHFALLVILALYWRTILVLNMQY